MDMRSQQQVDDKFMDMLNQQRTNDSFPVMGCLGVLVLNILIWVAIIKLVDWII